NGIVINGTEIYLTGSFGGNAIFDTLSITSVGSDDVFIAKYNTNGDVQWLRRAGGTNTDRANGIAIYGTDVFITGWYAGTAIFDATSITSIGSGDVFLAKYNDNGVVQWVRSAGGTNGDE